MFFFKQKTAYEMRISDWSSDVCSSDLFLLGCVGSLSIDAVVVIAGRRVDDQRTAGGRGDGDQPVNSAVGSVAVDVAVMLHLGDSHRRAEAVRPGAIVVEQVADGHGV